MPASSAPSPVRVGILGLGRRGRYALERWVDHDAVRVVAACDHDPVMQTVAETLCGRIVTLDELLSDGEVEAVLLAVPIPERAALARRVLAAGKHLVTDPGLAATAGEAALLYAAADAWGRRIAVWSPWRDEIDFRTALGVTRSSESGLLRVIRFERWEPRAETAEDRFGTVNVPLSRSFVHRLDQLVALADAVPDIVYAVPLPGGGTTSTIRFHEGLTASLTIHASASTRFDHGWAIDGMQGGYAAGRRWVRAAEEVYDLPAECAAIPTPEETLRAVLIGETSDRRAESLRLIALATAVAESLESGQSLPVEPTP